MSSQLENESQAAIGLDVRGYPGKWARAKHVCRQRIIFDTPYFWEAVRKYFLELGGKYLTEESEVNQYRFTMHGPGEVVQVTPDINYVRHLQQQLCALPNAFDTVTGKINRENDKAVILSECLQLALNYARYPMYYKHG